MTADRTPQPLTADQLAEIQARMDAATAGPWSSTVIDSEVTSLRAGGQTASDSVRVGWLHNMAVADSKFIAHARTDVPVLLAEVDRLSRTLSTVLTHVRHAKDMERDTYSVDRLDLLESIITGEYRVADAAAEEAIR